MKFSAVALLSMVSTVVAFPDGFVEQCCIGVPPPEGAAAFLDSANLGISGYGSDACIGLKPGCKTWETYCGEQFNGRGVLEEGGLLCGCRDAQGKKCGISLDTPWTCAVDVGNAYATETGYLCGRTVLCKTFGACFGDPHFQTLGGDWYDFHGECDLKFFEVPDFGNGLGMQVQIRTKQRYEYSYVEAAALKIGDDVLEVGSHGQYFLNDVDGADLKGATMAGKYRIEHEIRDTHHQIFTVYTGLDGTEGAEAVRIKTFKDLVAVSMVNAYESTFAHIEGMMGDYYHGTMFARDGQKVISDPVEFGMEWQVVPEQDGQLFQTPSPIEGKCKMPAEKAAEERRRLGEAVPLEAAVAACEAVDSVHHENCVYDVMATGDLEIAHAGVF